MRAESDAPADMETLRAQANAYLATENLEPASRYEGTDPDKVVSFVANPRGRILGVDVSPTWRGKIEPDQFADAVYKAYAAAVRKASTTELIAGVDQPAGKPVSEPPAARADELPFDEWLAATRARLERIDEGLRDVAAGTTEPDREIRSPNGYLTLRLSGGGLAGIAGNTGALQHGDPDLIRQDVLDVFRDANLTAER
jgi:hypothetical protein